VSKGRRRIGVRIDMTPMVDVAFLLLIFFMTTTQFKPPEEVSVQLPESSSEIKTPESGIIILTINKDGRIFLQTDKSQTGEVARADLANSILQMRAQNPTAPWIVKGDEAAEFGVMADVMDAMAEAKANRFNLMTDLKVR